MFPSFSVCNAATTDCRCVLNGHWDNSATTQVCDPSLWGSGTSTMTDSQGTVTVCIA
jgi:hypothetical protein